MQSSVLGGQLVDTGEGILSPHENCTLPARRLNEPGCSGVFSSSNLSLCYSDLLPGLLGHADSIEFYASLGTENIFKKRGETSQV